MTTLGEFLESGYTPGDVVARMPRGPWPALPETLPAPRKLVQGLSGRGVEIEAPDPNAFYAPKRQPGSIENRRAPGYEYGNEAIAAQVGEDFREGSYIPAMGGLAAVVLGGAATRRGRPTGEPGPTFQQRMQARIKEMQEAGHGKRQILDEMTALRQQEFNKLYVDRSLTMALGVRSARY